MSDRRYEDWLWLDERIETISRCEISWAASRSAAAGIYATLFI